MANVGALRQLLGRGAFLILYLPFWWLGAGDIFAYLLVDHLRPSPMAAASPQKTWEAQPRRC